MLNVMFNCDKELMYSILKSLKILNSFIITIVPLKLMFRFLYKNFQSDPLNKPFFLSLNENPSSRSLYRFANILWTHRYVLSKSIPFCKFSQTKAPTSLCKTLFAPHETYRKEILSQGRQLFTNNHMAWHRTPSVFDTRV